MRLDRNGNLVQDPDEWMPPAAGKSTAPVTYHQNDYEIQGEPGDSGPQTGTTAPGYTANDLRYPKAKTDTPPPTPAPTPDPGTNAKTGAPPDPYALPGTGYSQDPNVIKHYLSQWSGMEGADPSLGGDPDYWVGAINKRGGLGNSNLQYWQDAGVGPGAFFRNPGREGGGTTTTQGPGLQGTGGGGSDLSSLLQQLLSGQLSASQSKQAGLDKSRADLSSIIKQAMGIYSSPVDANDPIISGRVTNYTGKVKRSLQDSREHMAERAHAEGLPTGAFDSWVGMGDIKGGQAIGDYEDSLIGDELKSRRAGLSDLIGKSGGLINSEDSSDLNRLMASIDSGLRSRGLDLTDKGQNQSYDLGLKGLDMSKYGIDTGASTADKNRNQQNSQFYDKYAQDEQFHNDDNDLLMRELLLNGGGL